MHRNRRTYSENVARMQTKAAKNINSDFYEYLHIQTDNNKLDIPEILLRRQHFDLYFLAEYLVSYCTHTFQAIYPQQNKARTVQ